jgi:hypothetical protein
MYRDQETIGDKLWERFNQKDKYQHGLYYQSDKSRYPWGVEVDHLLLIKRRSCNPIK